MAPIDCQPGDTVWYAVVLPLEDVIAHLDLFEFTWRACVKKNCEQRDASTLGPIAARQCDSSGGTVLEIGSVREGALERLARVTNGASPGSPHSHRAPLRAGNPTSIPLSTVQRTPLRRSARGRLQCARGLGGRCLGAAAGPGSNGARVTNGAPPGSPHSHRAPRWVVNPTSVLPPTMHRAPRR